MAKVQAAKEDSTVATYKARIDAHFKIVAAAFDAITLDVGGTIFKTSKDTLLRVEGSFFHALLASDGWKPAKGAYFLDLDPDLFRRVLAFLRSGKLSIAGLSYLELKDLTSMLEYLSLDVRGAATRSLRWEAHAPGVAVTTDLRSIERLTSQDGDWVVSDRELTGGFRVRVDAAPGVFCVAVGPKEGAHLCPKTHCRSSYWANSDFYLRGVRIPSTLPKIRVGDVVTLRRGLSHVEYAVNDGQPFVVVVQDPSEDLFAVVSMHSAGTTLTILD